MSRPVRRLLVVGSIIVGISLCVVYLTRPRPIEVAVVSVERGRVEATVTNTRAGTVKAIRRAKIAPAVAEGYDLPFMAQKILGRHWKTLDEPSQKRWIDTFGGLTSATYAERMTGFTGQVFEVLKVEPSQRGTALVYSQVVTPNETPIALNYRMRPDGDSWRIIDVYLNGTVSELALRRSEYAAVLQRDGFEKLVASIDEKIAAGQIAGETVPASAAQ